MSTKAIDECLYYLRGIDFDRETLDAARAELSAIRVAAKHVSEGEGDKTLRNCGEDYDAERSLFDAIAREAT